MRRLFLYREERGRVRAVEVRPDEIRSRKDFDIENYGTTSEKALRGYYEIECQKGSAFRSGYSKSEIKQVHENKIAEQ